MKSDSAKGKWLASWTKKILERYGVSAQSIDRRRKALGKNQK